MNPTAPSTQNPIVPQETYESLAGRLDYHLLAPTLAAEELAEACRFARENGLRAVVVRPCDVELVTQWVGRDIVVAGVAGYPEGTSTTATKLYEARDLLRLGAREIEFVLNPARMISRQFQHVETELMQMSKSCHESGARLTVVYNNRWLSDDLKIIATKICRRVEVDVLSVDRSDSDLALLKPLLKDVLALKLATPVESLEETLAAREAGYVSVASNNPGPILEAWREHLKALQQPPTPPVS